MVEKGEGEKIGQFEKRGSRGGRVVLKEGIRRTLIKKGVRIFKHKGGGGGGIMFEKKR